MATSAQMPLSQALPWGCDAVTTVPYGRWRLDELHRCAQLLHRAGHLMLHRDLKLHV